MGDQSRIVSLDDETIEKERVAPIASDRASIDFRTSDSVDDRL